jgi:hypothetical protein
VPDHIASTAAVPWGGKGADGSQSYITGFGLPFEDALNLVDAPLRMAFGDKSLPEEVRGGLREIASRSNPLFAKPAVELMAGQSMFFDGPGGGRALDDLDPTLGRIRSNITDMISGEQTAKADPLFGMPSLEYAFSNSPFARVGTTVRQVTDKRKLSGPLKMALNLLSGVKINDVSPSVMDSLIRDRIGELLKERGARKYSRDYLPEDAAAKLSEEDQQEVDVLLQSLKVIDKRFKIRREEKEKLKEENAEK